MKSGVLGVVHGEFTTVDGEVYDISKDGKHLQRCIDIQNEFESASGKKVYSGYVAKEEMYNNKSASIEDGEVKIQETNQIKTDSGRFAVISDDLVILEPGTGTFAFDIIGQQVDALVERAELDLDSFVSDNENADYWQYGFYNTGFNTENGTLYGNEIEDDKNSHPFMKSSSVNQVGFDYVFRDQPVKATLAESGYAEVYQPSEWELPEFVDYIIEELSPYVSST